MNRRFLPVAVFLGALLLTVAVLGVVRAVNNARNVLDVAANQVASDEPDPLPVVGRERPARRDPGPRPRKRRRNASAPADPTAASRNGGPELSARPTDQYLPSFQRPKNEAATKEQRRKQRLARIAAMSPEERQAFLEERRARRAARRAAQEQGTTPPPPPEQKLLDQPPPTEALDTAEPPPLGP